MSEATQVDKVQKKNPSLEANLITNHPAMSYKIKISTFPSHLVTQTHRTLTKRDKVSWNGLSFVFIFSFMLFSSASFVSSMPIEEEPLEFQEFASIPQDQHILRSENQHSVVENGGGGRVRLEKPQGDMNFLVHPKSQFSFPSFLKSWENDENSMNVGEQQHLQKLQQNPLVDVEESSEWETVIDPNLYLLTEWNPNSFQQQRMRRNSGPSLSIVNPLDVLRQRLLLEIARRKMRQSHNQIMANAEILKNIGRRRRR